MSGASGKKLRVAIASAQERQRTNLQSLVEKGGLEVVINEPPCEEFLSKLSRTGADVLLLDLDDEADAVAPRVLPPATLIHPCMSEQDFLDQLLEQFDLPVLFNDSASTHIIAATHHGDWGRRLAQKLVALVVHDRQAKAIKDEAATTAPTEQPASVPEPVQITPAPEPLRPADDVQGSTGVGRSRLPASRDIGTSLYGTEGGRPGATKPAVPKIPVSNAGVLRVWVLGASIGGPQAVKSFLNAIPVELPIAFVLAQHIGTGFATLLAQQLDSTAAFQVIPAQSGHSLRHHQVVLAPVEENLVINAEGQLELKPFTEDDRLYRPSIDAIMTNVAQRFGRHAGAIIFSGMGNDGLRGAQSIIEHGGVVWAQDAESCLISSMPDHARKAGLVSFNGTPEMLAKRLVEQLSHVDQPDVVYLPRAREL
ncbi:MAG TPA: chemotaxis protein CheB [Gammaproteobacteria bacterium]|nr:chemotaxis protein CheB [Gammaproteobacteria bacterium]